MTPETIALIIGIALIATCYGGILIIAKINNHI
jgi:hypothetical protein